jgi:hypothetical protein
MVLCAALLVSPALADFAVKDLKPVIAGNTLTINGEIDLAIPAKVEEAVSKGIPLEVLIEVRFYRTRSWLWADRITTWVLKREVRYHALSGQYLVTDKSQRPEAMESFTSLQQALRAMGTLNAVELGLPLTPTADTAFELRLRASLDIESLPAPLRPVAYTSLDWRLDSGWSTWSVAH